MKLDKKGIFASQNQNPLKSDTLKIPERCRKVVTSILGVGESELFLNLFMLFELKISFWGSEEIEFHFFKKKSIKQSKYYSPILTQ